MAPASETTLKDVKKGSQEFSNYAREAADTVMDAKSDLKTIAGRAGRSIRSFVVDGQREISHVAEDAKEAIRTRPLQASLVALGAGVLLGLIMRR